MTFNSFSSCLMSKSQWRLPLTPPGVMSTPNSGMTIHTLVLTVDSFSCSCNSIDRSMSKGLQEHFSLSSSYCCMCINTSVFSNENQFQFVQQCIQISTRINSSNYIRTSVFILFKTYPIFNSLNFSSDSHHYIATVHSIAIAHLQEQSITPSHNKRP